MRRWIGITAVVTLLAGCGSSQSEPPVPAETRSISPLPTGGDEGPTAAPRDGGEPKSGSPNSPWHAPLPQDFTWPASSAAPSPDGDASPRGVPDLSEVDRTDPKAVAQAFAQSFYSSDFRADASRVDAARRARPLAAGELRQSMTHEVGRSEVSWLELQRAQGWVEVTVEDATEFGQEEGNSEQRAVSSWIVTLEYHGINLPGEELLLHLTTTKLRGEWSVVGMRSE